MKNVILSYEFLDLKNNVFSYVKCIKIKLTGNSVSLNFTALTDCVNIISLSEYIHIVLQKNLEVIGVLRLIIITLIYVFSSFRNTCFGLKFIINYLILKNCQLIKLR